MKRLILMRHAKSSWDTAVARDFDRPLNPRGVKAGKHVGTYLRREGLSWDVLVSSPSVRTRQTVERLEKGYGGSLEPIFDDRLYMASTTSLLTLARGFDDAYDSIFLLGHNPGMQGLALSLTPVSDDPARSRIEAKFPTGALVVLDMAIARWAALSPACATLHSFVKPKDLKKKRQSL